MMARRKRMIPEPTASHGLMYHLVIVRPEPAGQFTAQPFGGPEFRVFAPSPKEAVRGRLGYLARPLNSVARVRAYSLLVGTVQLFNQMIMVPFDLGSEAQYQQLRAQQTGVGTQDLKIAAVALTNNLILVTRNRRDFGRVPGITIDDWSV